MCDPAKNIQSLKDLEASFAAGPGTPSSVKDDELKRRLKYKRDMVDIFDAGTQETTGNTAEGRS